MLKASGGKIPQWYKSAYEKWHEKKGPVDVLLEDEDEDDASDWSETELGISATICGACEEQDDDFHRFVDSNPFNAIGPDDDENNDDEAETIAALQKITNTITDGPKCSRRNG